MVLDGDPPVVSGFLGCVVGCCWLCEACCVAGDFERIRLSGLFGGAVDCCWLGDPCCTGGDLESTRLGAAVLSVVGDASNSALPRD